MSAPASASTCGSCSTAPTCPSRGWAPAPHGWAGPAGRCRSRRRPTCPTPSSNSILPDRPPTDHPPAVPASAPHKRDRDMAAIDLKSLVGKLNTPCRRALEGAAGLTLSRSQFNVEIEHWLIKLLEDGQSDITACMQHFEIDA